MLNSVFDVKRNLHAVCLLSWSGYSLIMLVSVMQRSMKADSFSPGVGSGMFSSTTADSSASGPAFGSFSGFTGVGSSMAGASLTASTGAATSVCGVTVPMDAMNSRSFAICLTCSSQSRPSSPK